MKQRILLIVAMLLIATPAFATVNITVTQGTAADVNKLTVRYDCNASEAVRAFALDFTLTNGGNPKLTFSNIADFNRGESNKPGGGYGIFPGQFRNQIDPANPNWYAQYYYPVAPSNDVDSNGQGMGESKMIVELGTLYKDTNAPGTSGTLFTVRLDPNSGETCSDLAVVTNAIRGGVVLENGSSVAPNITITPTHVCVKVCPAAPATLKYPAADGNNGRYQVSWSAAANADSYRLDRSANSGGTWTTIYSGTDTSKCDDVNTGSYRYRVAAVASGCPDACNTGTSDCAVMLCFPTSEPNMSNWKAMGKPRCWCYQRQCKGDATGVVEGGAKSGYYWVGSPDLQVLLKAYQVLEPTFGNGVQGEPNICASFKHYKEGGAKSGYYWVGSPDLQILLKNYQVLEPTFGSGIGSCPAGSSGSRYTLPTDNKPCN
jgi:hypothetical protein